VKTTPRAFIMRGLLAAAITVVAYMPICNLAFRCGCTWPWAGGVAHCNIHNPRPPHCPVCSGSRGAGFFLLIAAPVFGGLWAAGAGLERLRRRTDA
jgi:hypothetical protein